MSKRLLLLVSLAIAAPAFAETPGVPLRDSVPHMIVTGEAEADVAPDQADLHLGVRQERKTAEEATDATAQAASAVIAAVKGHGVEAGDIGTTFVLTETFDVKKDEHGQVVGKISRGYEADEEITVRIRDVAGVGPLARDLIAKGSNGFRSIGYFYSKDKQKRAELATAAMRDAFDQAKTYTSAIGLKLGRVLQIGEDPSPNGTSGTAADMPVRRAPPLSGDGVAAIPTEPGRQHLSESVSVVWEIVGQAR